MAGIGWREGARLVAASLLRRDRPLLAHLVVTRYCNLDCAYCNEYDKVSAPVPFDILADRIDRIAALGTLFLTFTGGEPLTNPDHERLISRARERGLAVTTITNGFLLTVKRIEAMNLAGLQGLQISIDGVKPDAITKKTLKSLRQKLELLARHAAFPVNINSVLGITEERSRDAIEVAHFARSLGFSHTVGVLHGDDGTLSPLSPTQRDVYYQLLKGGKIGHRFNHFAFQKNLIEGRPNRWKCRAGARYLYVCEEGLVHYCSQQRGTPGIPLADYGRDDIRREFMTPKSCAPLCTVSCVHQASYADRWRGGALSSSPLPSAGPAALPS